MPIKVPVTKAEDEMAEYTAKVPDHPMWEVLDKVEHERLVADIDKFASMAGILPHWIWSKTEDYCGDGEQLWLRKFKFHAVNNRFGLVLIGDEPKVPFELRMSAMCGRLTRNFIWGQMTTVQALLPLIEKNDLPEATCLFLPTMYAGKGGMPTWKQAMLLDLLMDRASKGKQTVIGIPHLDDLEADFGVPFASFVKNGFHKIEVE